MQHFPATFIKSSPTLAECPPANLPEYAFIGRSNVGKSSLINCLTGRKKLAQTSSRPGKTKLINHFLIDERWYLVDLPGYGWANVPKPMRAQFKAMIEDYLLERKNLITTFVLLDSRHPPQRIDLEFMTWLGECKIPFARVFTKADKMKPTKLANQLMAYDAVMLEQWAALPETFVTSAEDGRGREDLLGYIESLHTAQH